MKKWVVYLLLCQALLLRAQAPAIAWQKVYGGSNYDRINRITPTSDKGYILAGESYSGISGDKTVANFGMYDFWIIKTDLSGNIEWQKGFGGTSEEQRPVIIETFDNGYLLTGETDSVLSGNLSESTHGFKDFWVLKLDSLGNIEWQNTMGGVGNDYPKSIVEIASIGYLLAGTSVSPTSEDKSEDNVGANLGPPYVNMSDYWVVFHDSFGNIIWDNTIGSIMIDSVTFSVKGTDGGYLLGGFSNGVISGDYNADSFGDKDCWLVKIDEQGNILWQKTLGGSLFDEPESAIATSDGGYLIGLSSKSNISGNKSENSKGGLDYWIVKIDAAGNIQWNKTIGGSGEEYMGNVSQDNDLNYYIAGVSNSPQSGDKSENSRGGYDFWVVKIDSAGDLIWDKTIGGLENELNAELQFNSDDNSITIGGTSLSSNSGDKTEITKGSADYWLVKLQSDGLTNLSFDRPSLSVYPNPTTKTLFIHAPKQFQTLRVVVSTIQGQIVQEEMISNIDTPQLDLIGKPGIYLVEIHNEQNEKVLFKVVKQ